MNEYLLSGSYVYDKFLTNKNQFHELKSSLINNSVDSIKNEFGGNAGNIAYNSTLLDQYPYLVGCLGSDSLSYKEHLLSIGLNPDTLTYFNNIPSASSYIEVNAQYSSILDFNAGALGFRPLLPKDISNLPDLWHLSADNPLTTIWLAKNAIENNKKYFFDPGQSLPYFFSGMKIFYLEDIIKNSLGIFLNNMEYELLTYNFKHNLNNFINEDQFIIRTLGSEGLELITKNHTQKIFIANSIELVEPTGCGDAFRSGFIYAYMNGYDLIKSAQLGATMSSFAIEKIASQNHTPTLDEIFERVNLAFNNKDLKFKR